MIKDIALKNRSFRGYDESFRFSREDLLEYIEIARICASSQNRQVLKFYIAYDKEMVDRIFPCTGWARELQPIKLPRDGKAPTAYIVICMDTTLTKGGGVATYGYDAGIAAQTMLLAAAEKGLGGIMIRNLKRDQLVEILGLPENLQPMIAVALGKPAEDVRIVDMPEDGKTAYYRDENDVHYVPKRSVEELVINY